MSSRKNEKRLLSTGCGGDRPAKKPVVTSSRRALRPASERQLQIPGLVRIPHLPPPPDIGQSMKQPLTKEQQNLLDYHLTKEKSREVQKLVYVLKGFLL
jgi:hypothetical protein